MQVYPAKREQEGSLLSTLLRLLLVSLCREYCSNIWMHSIFRECTSAIPNFSQRPAPASPHTPLITHTNISILGVRERRIGSLTDITIPGNRVESGRRGRYVDIWVDVMKNRTFSLQSCVTPWNPASLFLAEFPPKPHTSLNVCTHTHPQHPPSCQPPHSRWLFELFSEGSLSWKHWPNVTCY